MERETFPLCWVIMETPRYGAICDSPLGSVLILAGEQGISHIQFYDQVKSPIMFGSNLFVEQCINELHGYFEGKRTEFSTPLAPSGTPFEENVWKTLTQEIGRAHV